MARPQKRSRSKRKCTCKCHIKQSLEMRKKGQQSGKIDTLARMPAQMPRDNSVTFKVKIRKK